MISLQRAIKQVVYFLKLMSFKKDSYTKIQKHIDRFNDLVIDHQNLGEEISNEIFFTSSWFSACILSVAIMCLFHHDGKTNTYNKVLSALLIDDL